MHTVECALHAGLFFLEFLGMKHLLLLSLWMMFTVANAMVGHSVFTQRPNDPDAVYFNPIKGDATIALQQAINDLKSRDNYGIVYLAPGEYRISGTIYVPPSIRLIGYGNERPIVILSKNSPGFDQSYPDDEGDAKYMFWFVANTVMNGVEPAEATSGTFFQGFKNIDVKIEDGNPQAVIFRTHYAQHSFIEHVEMHIGCGKAGIFEVGNEIESVVFHGGDYGIYTRKTSPGWQMTILNTLFEGQREACIRTMEAGMTLVRVTMRNAPIGLEIWPGFTDVAFMEDCILENLSEAGVMQSGILTPTNQFNALNVVCRRVPCFLKFREGDSREVRNESEIYCVGSLSLGLSFDSMESDGEYALRNNLRSLAKMPTPPRNDIPLLPDMSQWINITDLGAVGDDNTDNTEVFLKAIEEYDVIYLPQGIYRVNKSLKFKPNTVMIGMSPVSTRIKLVENSPAFSGFGEPVPLIETPEGGRCILSGIGLEAMGFNYRAVTCKWMAGEESYMNDVHFSGWATAKGPQRFSNFSQQMSNSFMRSRIMDRGVEESWDNQHWNLWVTQGGGGIFKNIWINNTYGSCGLFVENTSTPGRIYEMSVEHHLRSEVRFSNASRWRLYALQLEEETREGNDVIPMELTGCHDLHFINFFVFRVISIVRPLAYAVRTWNSHDIHFYNFHNFTQMRFTINNSVYEANKRVSVRPWEFARLTITGNEAQRPSPGCEDGVEWLHGGFEYAEGIVHDNKGNIFFSEERLRKVYMWNTATQTLSLLLDLPWQPLSLATDTENRLLVMVKYYPQPESRNTNQRMMPLQSDLPKPSQLPDHKGTTYSWWGNFGFEPMVYAVDPSNPNATIQMLPLSSELAFDGKVDKVYYATHRWRDLHDFDSACVYRPDSFFVAPDGCTVIPRQYDLLRSSSLQPATPGGVIYQVDEFAHRVKRFNVDNQGFLSEPELFAERGEHGIATDHNGNVYIAEGNILVYDSDGQYLRTIHTPEGPNSLTCSGNYLYFTTRNSFCRVKTAD